MDSRQHINKKHKAERGFSLIELLITLTITLVILAVAFTLLAATLNKKLREEDQASVLANANLGLGRMAEEIVNAGFGVRSNGIVAADSGEERIRVRANLNALMKQTSSGAVTDVSEDVQFFLVPGTDGLSSLVRVDVPTGTSAILATSIDDSDANGDGDGDGLTFTFFDAAGSEVQPQEAHSVGIALRVRLPQIGVPGSPGFQPGYTKALASKVVLRNTRLEMY